MAQQIESKDIKLYASEKLNDADDGGGRVTANEIESGKINNVFQDISRVDHANGSVELRKLYMGIRTENNAPLLGAHMLITEPPKDDNVTTLIFQTQKELRETDTRVHARDYLENYYIKAARQFVYPLGLNVEFSTTINLFAPSVITVDIKAGDTIVLFDSASNREEYVKISAISIARQTFTYEALNDWRSFEGQVVRCQLSSPLMQTWNGGEARPNGVTAKNLSIFSTLVTDAARYRGATKLLSQLNAGETNATVEHVLQPLVPVARLEQALVNRSPYTDIAPVIRGTDSTESPLVIEVTPDEDEGVLYMPTAVTRGSMTIDSRHATWSENGSGTFTQTGGGQGAELSVSYTDGLINYSGLKDERITIRYQPAAAADIPAVTTGLEITQANLGLVYTFDLSDTPPEPSTIVIEYMAANDWLTMTDNGSGLIAGQGTGEIDYKTGQIQVTLEREPEMGSHILLSFLPERSTLFDRKSGTRQTEDIKYDRQISFGAIIKPNTFTIKDMTGARQSTDDGKGRFSGTAGEGTIDYAEGRITLNPATSAFEEKYQVTALTSDTGKVTSNYAASASGRNISLNLGRTVMPGTLSLQIPLTSRVKKTIHATLYKDKSETISKQFKLHLRDDGEGKITNNATNSAYSSGTIDYATGAISLPSILKVENYVNIEPTSFGSASKVEYNEYQQLDGQVTASYLYDQGNYSTATKEVSIEAAQIRITDIGKYEPIMPRSLWLRIAGKDYFDNGEGRLIGSYSALTRAGTQVGQIDYANGMLSLQNVSAVSSEVRVCSLVVLSQGMTSSNLIFAIKDRPLRHSSFQMNVTSIDGTVRRYTTNEDGLVTVVGTGEQIGTVNVQTGVVSIDASTLSEEVESRASVLGSLRYNAVKSESMPVDPDIVGLDVQRLPIDGRVPIFKLGDTIVLNHSTTESIDTPAPGITISLNRNNIAEVTISSNGVALDPSQYEVDTKAGKVTFANPLKLEDEKENPLSGNWQATNRIEHMTLATRVQQNGTITLQVPSAHDFPRGTTASSALLFGDLQADVLNYFTQRTWQNNAPNWTNLVDSSGTTTARFDSINYPIKVSNSSAITDKWAIIFRSATQVDVVSENLGVIASGVSINTQIAPINPVTNTPYFVIEVNGWGGGWATGNALRFNTKSALAPFWVSRTVTPAQGITESDGFTLSPRGDSQ